jgi:23S rRNA G2445 N2-methylase RlmL
MCGSGTLLIEAGAWAARQAPGLTRERFGFERWGTFDASARRALAALREEARSLQRQPPPLFGSDSDPRALDQTRENAARAGLPVQLRALPFTRLKPTTEAGALLANPPYGQRLQAPASLGQDIDGLLERFERHQRALIVPRTFRVTKRASRWLEVYNGPIECEFRRYDAASTTGRAPASNESEPSSASAQGSSASRSALRRSSALTRGPTTPK